MNNSEENSNIELWDKFLETEVLLVADTYKKEWDENVRASKKVMTGDTFAVSGIIICKNEEEHIASCIESALTAGLDEIIVIDTGSSDETLNIVEKYSSNYANVNLFHHVWIDDFSAARNFGIAHAAYDWVFFIDADERFINQERRSIQELIGFYHNLCGDQIGFCPVIMNSALNKLYNNPRIFNKTQKYRYYGHVHEILRAHDTIYRPIPFICLNILMEHSGYANHKIGNKLIRNLSLLDRNIEKEPENPLWYCYKLRDGRDFLSTEQKNECYRTVQDLCKMKLPDSFYQFCFDWASVLILESVLQSKEIKQAEYYLDELINYSKCSKEDMFYLETSFELCRMEQRLCQLEEQCENMRQEHSFSTSMVNTYGYHMDDLYMKLLEKQHKMAEYIKMKDFLFSVGYFIEIN